MTIDLRSSFDFSVNHLGVLLHGETQVLVLHGFFVEVDLWDGRGHFAKLQFVLPLLDICFRSWMLRDWLAAAFLCGVFLIVLRLVSVVVLWFALPALAMLLSCLPLLCSCLVLLLAMLLSCLPLAARVLFAVGFTALLPAVGFCSSACCWLCSSRFFSSFSRSSMVFSRGPRTLVALLHSSRHRLVGCGSVCASHHWLVGCGSVSDGSLAVVPSVILFTTGSLAVVPSVLLLQSHIVVGYDSVARFWHHPTPPLSVAPLRD